MIRQLQTLRARLAILLLAVFGVILSGLSASVLALREDYLREDFDDRLNDRAEAIIDTVTATIDDAARAQWSDLLQTRLNRYRFPGYFIQVRSPDYTVIARSPRLGDRTLPLGEETSDAKATLPVTYETITGQVAADLVGSDGQLRVLTCYHSEPGAPEFYVQVAADLGRVTESRSNLRRVFLFVIAVGLLLTGLASWLIAKRSLAPLNKITTIADRLRADDLSHRLEQPKGQDEVAVMVATINRMLDRLTNAFGAQEQFIADVAHELKTPLAILLGEAQVLSQQERSEQQYTRFIASVQDEVRTLAQTVDSLLTLARAEAGLPMAGATEVSINEAVTDVVERCNTLAEQRSVRVVPVLAAATAAEMETTVTGDGPLLRLMFSNLLRNAIRHSPSGATVNVTVSQNAQIKVSVRDRGPGIPDEYLDKVFDRFFRVPDRETTFQSTGLGLTLVRGIARLHGGEVTVSNHADGGCEFVVQLPLGQQQVTQQDGVAVDSREAEQTGS